ncbi:MAG TPA: hypothetical protein VFP58_13160 [Candidatus Eisenbacteria bacterium]|nr:hypothetical protein [Candidatus Eisenbacteria bacterium]
MKSELRVRSFGERPLPAQSGREFTGRIELVAPGPGTVQGFEIVGPGWTVIDVDAPRAFPMVTCGQRRIVTFRAIPQDPTQPLTVRGTYNGSRVERSIRLDAASLERKRPARYSDRGGPRGNFDVTETRPAGWHSAMWDGRSRAGSDAPAGVYFARLERQGEVLTRRIVLVR